jgi:hypothetical protein
MEFRGSPEVASSTRTKATGKTASKTSSFEKIASTGVFPVDNEGLACR